MKYSILIYLILTSFLMLGQMNEIRSKELDGLIWEKINDRLVSLNKKPIKNFDNSDDSEMRLFAGRVAERLIVKDAVFEHSNNDSISRYCGGECIYADEVTGNHELDIIQKLNNNDLNYFAEIVFQGWLGSDAHREAISEDYYTNTTVYTIINYSEDEKYFKLVAVWLEENEFWGSLEKKDPSRYKD